MHLCVQVYAGHANWIASGGAVVVALVNTTGGLASSRCQFSLVSADSIFIYSVLHIKRCGKLRRRSWLQRWTVSSDVCFGIMEVRLSGIMNEALLQIQLVERIPFDQALYLVLTTLTTVGFGGRRIIGRSADCYHIFNVAIVSMLGKAWHHTSH